MNSNPEAKVAAHPECPAEVLEQERQRPPAAAFNQDLPAKPALEAGETRRGRAQNLDLPGPVVFFPGQPGFQVCG